MPNDEKSIFGPYSTEGNVSPFQRYVALKTLREYIYLQSPASAAAGDFVEDIPSLRPYGGFFNDIGPSLTTIQSDPEKRKVQLANAVKGVASAKKSTNLPGDMLSSAGRMAVGSIPASILFSILTRSKSRKAILNLKRPLHRKMLFKSLSKDVPTGMIYGAGMGAAIPLLSHVASPSAAALSQASNIIQQKPYSTSLPGAAINTSLNYNKKNDELSRISRNMLITGAAGGAIGAGGNLALNASTNLSSRLLNTIGLKSRVHPVSLHNARKAGLVGTGVGASLGLLTSLLNNDQYGVE